MELHIHGHNPAVNRDSQALVKQRGGGTKLSCRTKVGLEGGANHIAPIVASLEAAPALRARAPCRDWEDRHHY